MKYNSYRIIQCFFFCFFFNSHWLEILIFIFLNLNLFVVFQLLKRVYGNLLVAPEDGKPNGCCFNLCYFYCKNFGLMVCCCSSLKGTTFRCSLTWMLFHPTKRRWSTRLAFSRETALLLSSRSTSSSRRRVVRERKGLLSITGMTSLCKLLELSSIGLQLTTNLVIICLINCNCN